MASASTENNNEKVTLKTSDGEEFLVEKQAVLQSTTIKHILEDRPSDDAIPLPNVDAKTLALVLEYCNKHANASSKEEEEEEKKSKEEEKFDSEFLKDMKKGALFDLVLAANYLNIKGLLDIVTQKIADSIKDLSHQKVRAMFNIENDFTPEEEAEVRKENEWAFEGFEDN